MVIDEPESVALRQYLAARPRLASSALARVEFTRAVKLHRAAAVTDAEDFLRSFYLVPVADEVLLAAADLASATLRSRDAIHLASALSLGGRLAAIVTYDQRMSRAAADLGLAVAAPGR